MIEDIVKLFICTSFHLCSKEFLGANKVPLILFSQLVKAESPPPCYVSAFWALGNWRLYMTGCSVLWSSWPWFEMVLASLKDCVCPYNCGVCLVTTVMATTKRVKKIGSSHVGASTYDCSNTQPEIWSELQLSATNLMYNF